MKQQDLVKHHHMNINELYQALAQKEQELVDARIKRQLNQEKNLHLSKNIRQDIARIKTIIRHQQLSEEEIVHKSPSSAKTPVSKSTKTPASTKPKTSKKATP